MVARTLLVRGVSLIALVFATVTPGTAQESRSGSIWDIAFQRLDGLSHNTVLSIAQDEQGFLWFGTSDGLNRYDGYDFTVYRHDPRDSTSLSNNNVKCLLIDRSGNLWVGTDGGLDRFDFRSGGFVRYALQSPSPSGKQARYPILDLLEDHRGRLWIAGHGLHRYDPNADRFTAYRHEPNNRNSLSSDHVGSLHLGRDGALWIVTADAVLHRFDPEKDRFVRYVLPKSGNHNPVVHEDETGRLWIGSMTFDYKRQRFTPLPDGLLDRYAVDVLEDHQGARWVGTDGGLYRTDPKIGRYLRVLMTPARGAYLQNSVRVLYEDRASTLWVGTLNGLFRLDPNLKPFRHLGHDPAENNTLASSTVMAVSQDSDGLIWVGTLGGGLNRFDRRRGTVVQYPGRSDASATSCHDLIWSLYGDNLGTLWIGTDQGLCALDIRSDRLSRYALPLPPAQEKQPPVNAIEEDTDGRLWLATNIGLYRFEPATGEFERFVPTDVGQDPPTSIFLQSLLLDRQGTLWIGTFFGRLYEFDTGTETFTRHPLPLGRDRQLVSEGIWAIHEGDDGFLWLGSDLGLTRFHPERRTIRHFTAHDGLPGSIVYAIQEDDLGRLWLSTNDGLVEFDDRLEKSRMIQVYDAGDGLQNTEFNRRAAFKGADGTLYFGGLNGLMWFHPSAVQPNRVVPPIVLTGIETSNRDTTVSINPFGLEELKLSYRDYTISFEFAALNFTNSSKNRYRYRMEGFDDTWIEAGTQRFARYTNLPAGEYVFQVLGSNNDGYWNEEGAALRLAITPPFWQTWWFRLSMAIIVIGVLTAAYRLRMARVIAMERMRLRIASDLHDDIGSNLSSIALLSDMVRSRKRIGDRERRHLAKISDSARTMIDALRDIVWSIDPDKDRTADLIDRMEDTASNLLTGIKYSFQQPDKKISGQLDMTARRQIFMMYKEIVHNIVRHARATEVTTEVRESAGAFRLTVSDNGDGFDTDGKETTNGSGLKYLRERAAEINADLVIESSPGRGTTIRVSVPIR